MVTVKQLLQGKGGMVHTIGRDATVLEAAQMMNQHKIGCLVILEDDQVIGIFTERDVLRRVVAECKDPATTRIDEVMTTDVFYCSLDTPIDEAQGIFKVRRIRHLPVVDGDNRLAGLVSIGDVNAWHAGAAEQTIHYLHEYIYGRT